MTQTSQERPAEVEGARKAYAYFESDGTFISTFSLETDVYNANRTLEYGQKDRGYIILEITDGVLQFPNERKSTYSINDFNGQLEQVIAQVEIPEGTLALEAIAKNLLEQNK